MMLLAKLKILLIVILSTVRLATRISVVVVTRQQQVLAIQYPDMLNFKQPQFPVVDIVGNDNKTINGTNNSIITNNTNFFEAAKVLPSNLASIVNVLGKRLLDDGGDSVYLGFSIQGKISHNNVKSYKYIMDEYGIFVGKLTAVYDEFDAGGTNVTRNTLANIRLIYLKIRSKYTEVNTDKELMDVVREFADEIFSKVEEQLLTIIQKSANINESYESIHLSLQVIMIDAFIKCQILERPSDATS
jgi:hypothetical protein